MTNEKYEKEIERLKNALFEEKEKNSQLRIKILTLESRNKYLEDEITSLYEQAAGESL